MELVWNCIQRRGCHPCCTSITTSSTTAAMLNASRLVLGACERTLVLSVRSCGAPATHMMSHRKYIRFRPRPTQKQTQNQTQTQTPKQDSDPGPDTRPTPDPDPDRMTTTSRSVTVIMWAFVANILSRFAKRGKSTCSSDFVNDGTNRRLVEGGKDWLAGWLAGYVYLA